MSERLKAAMDAHRTAPRTRGMDTSGPMRAALAAADAVMFSDEAIERAASCVDYEMTDPNVTAQRLVKLVLGALKGVGDE